MEKYFLKIGSPGQVQVQVTSLNNRRHHAGWLELDSFAWTRRPSTPASSDGPGLSSGHELELTRPSDEVSTHLKLHCRSGTNFDVAVLDIWDGKTQRSTFKVQFDRVTIASYQWNPFFHKDTIVLSFETMKLSKAAGAQMITIDPAPSQWAVSQAAK